MGTFARRKKSTSASAFIWLSFWTASGAFRRLQNAAWKPWSYWTAWVTAHCQPATWFQFPSGMEMKLFLRSVGCVIGTAYSLHMLFFLAHYKIYKTSCFHLFHFFFLFILICYFKLFNWNWPGCKIHPEESTATPQIFVILHSCRYRSAVPPAVRNKQEDGIGNSGSTSQHVWDYLNIVHSTAERASTANWQNGDVSFVAFYFSGEPGRSSSQESVGPEANAGLDVLLQVQALVRCPVFAWPRAVRGCRNRTQPSSTNNRAESVAQYSKKIIRSSESGAARLWPSSGWFL